MSTHDEILEALATGELNATNEQVRTELAQSAELRQRWQALQKVQSALSQIADERREDLELAGNTSGSPAEDQMLERARVVFQNPETSHSDTLPTRRLNFFPLSIAAALLLSVGLWLINQRPNDTFNPADIPTTLGSELELLSPIGDVQRYDEFQWNYKLTDGFAFEVILWNESTGEELWTSPRLKAANLRLPPDLELPAHLRWEVWVLDSGGNSVASGAAEASLRQ